MSISNILEQKKEDLSDAEKIKAIAEIVSQARKSYGNSDAVVTSPEINTTDGVVELQFVSVETKLSLVKQEVVAIKMAAIEFEKSNEGVNRDKMVEQLLATSPIMVNLADTAKFSYL